ncbi:hypothetical protein GGR57DRAFT_465953 [Xylariaceae sp. FL1272]|nr:hypothetical protein GGR57DRAFT_465953 [Xylariaceae sp. FL1272]
MASIFQSLEAQDLTDDEKPMFDVLKASLLYPSTDAVRAKRLADDIIFFCHSANGDEEYEGILTIAWALIFDMICCIPPDHAWHDCWVNAIKELKGRGTLPARNDDHYDLFWAKLPCFLIELDTHMNRVYEKDNDFQNLNFFVARLYATNVERYSHFPIIRLRDALERRGGQPQPYLVWVASEWLIRCAEHIYEAMTNTENIAQKTGLSLGEDIADRQDITPIGVGRWKFWKDRIAEERAKLLASNSEPATADLAKRLGRALERMEEAEKTAL